MEKESYYIGYIFKNNQINNLKNIQNILNNKKYNLKNIINSNKFHTPFIYLGDFNEFIANDFINYLNNLFMVIIQENNNLKCNFTKLDVVNIDNTNGVIMNYNNDILKNKIIPFIKKYGTDNIIDTNYKDNILLYIPIIKFDTNNFENNKNKLLNSIYIPNNNEFIIKSIDIYKKNKNNDIILISSYPFEI